MKIIYHLFTSSIILICLLFSCKYSGEALDGRSAYQLKQYAVAADLFQKDYKDSKHKEDKAFFAYMTAQCFESMNELKNSLDWYRKAVELDYGSEAIEGYAYALKADEQYENAATIFNHLISEYGADKTFSDEIANCEQATRWKKERLAHIVTIESSGINSDYSDYSPIFLNQNTLIFTSDRKESQGGEQYNWTGNQFSDFFQFDLRTNGVTPFDGPFNTSNNEGTGTFNIDHTEFYFTRCFDEENDHYCKIYFSYNDDGNWSPPELLPFQKIEVNYGHPTFFQNDQLLIYSAKDEEGRGGYDLFAMKREDGGWSEPFILDGKINTPGNEKFPTSIEDTLYFSSDFMAGMGGLDIFKTYPDSEGSWHRPINLQSPINSGADDFALIRDTYRSGRGNIIESGFFSSSRNTGKGGDDIYHYTIKKRLRPDGSPKDSLPSDIDDNQEDYLFYLAGTVYANVREDASNPNSTIIGRKKLQKVPVVIYVGGDTIDIITNEKGQFVQQILLGKLYNIWANADYYLNKSFDFSTKEIVNNASESVQTFNVSIGLDKIIRGREITLENIYYDFNEAYIREDAMPTLNNLAILLRDNPNIDIKLGSHTDCRASDDFNIELSNRRAKSAVDYLISKGIPPSRLSSQGFGETKLLINCVCENCTEEEHQTNRRTTFEIL